MFCPLIKTECVQNQCAWWDHGNKCCAVLGLVVEVIKASEYNQPATRVIEHKVMVPISSHESLKPSVQQIVKQEEVLSEPKPRQDNTERQTGESVPSITF
jgi:hypothetical protein